MDTEKNYNNPNANYFQPGQGGNPIIPPNTSTTINAGTLGQTPNIQFPQTPTTLNAPSLNTSVSAPIVTAESIIQQGQTATPAEQKQQSILDRIAGLIGGNQTKTTIQNQADQAAGVSQATSAFNDLNTQLEGLNNQSTALQNEAQYTIPNTAQNSVEGKGVTAGGLAPLTASQLRANQIKQGAIATQALTVKSALFGAQGKLALAKDAADKAATAQYEEQQQQIDFQKAQLDAIAPTLNKEQKAQAALQAAKLQDRQTQIDNAKDDKKTILALATATLKLYPNDPAAQYAAQQALAESNKEQPDLQTALSLVGKYQQDPAQVQKDIDDHLVARAQLQKLNKETSLLGEPTPAEKKATASALKEAEASIPVMNDKIKAATVLLSHPGLDSRVGPNPLARGAFAIKDSFGAGQDFAGGIHKLVNGLTIDNLVAAKARGATFGALSEGELGLLASSATAINDWEIKDDKGNGTGVWDIDEKSFKKEIGVIQELTQRALDEANKTSGNTTDTIPKGTDGASYGYPGYVSDGTQWVAK